MVAGENKVLLLNLSVLQPTSSQGIDLKLAYLFIINIFFFSLQSVDFEAVAVTVKELVSYALTINSNNHFWLIIQADIYFGK